MEILVPTQRTPGWRVPRKQHRDSSGMRMGGLYHQVPESTGCEESWVRGRPPWEQGLCWSRPCCWLFLRRRVCRSRGRLVVGASKCSHALSLTWERSPPPRRLPSPANNPESAQCVSPWGVLCVSVPAAPVSPHPSNPATGPGPRTLSSGPRAGTVMTLLGHGAPAPSRVCSSNHWRMWLS